MQHSLIIDSKPVPIRIRKRKTSRRMVIRYQPLHEYIGLTLPRYATIRQGLDFIRSKQEWIAQEVRMHAQKIPFEDGSSIPVLGQLQTLRYTGGRGVVFAEHDSIMVPGDAEFMARRVREWLKKAAQRHIACLAHEKAAELGVTITHIALRDTRSLWGSCNNAGRLSFSWRLVFAPPEVLDYVVCHEVAHLKELNHSKRFWEHVASLCPHWQTSRRWLSNYGGQLYRYG